MWFFKNEAAFADILYLSYINICSYVVEPATVIYHAKGLPVVVEYDSFPWISSATVIYHAKGLKLLFLRGLFI